MLDDELLSQHKSVQNEREDRLARVPGCFRAMILLCICFLTFGSYWVFDTPGAIQTQLEAWFGPSYTNADNSLLYSIYSWPNTVLALFGGFIVDRITGVRLGALIFCALIWAGQFLFALGVQSKTYWVCVLGRFVFGLGGESLTVVQNTFVIRWFEGPYMALVFGLVLAFARVGSSVNFAVTPGLASSGVPFSVWFGLGTCTLSLIMCILLVILDYCGKDYVENKTAEVSHDNISHSPPSHLQDGEVQQDSDDSEAEQLPSLLHIMNFPKSAWLLFLVCLFFYQGVLTFYQVASNIMQKTGNHYSPDTASLYVSIPSFCSIVLSPAFGRLIDVHGRALTFILTASWGLMFCHVAFFALAYNVISISPVVIMMFIGVFYALGAASMWPILNFIIPKHMTSTGYGMMTAVQNLGLAVFPLVISAIQSLDGVHGTVLEYGAPIIIFILCVGIGAVLTIMLLFIDVPGEGGTWGRLNASASDRAKIDRFICPITITQNVMVNPTLASDGYSYEREEIERHLMTHSTSPMKKGHKMTVHDLIANDDLKNEIDTWVKTGQFRFEPAQQDVEQFVSKKRTSSN